MHYFALIKLFCFVFFIPFCSQAQIIRYGEVYGDDSTNGQFASQSIIDKEGGRYTLVSSYNDFIVDSAGTPITIKTVVDNGPGCSGDTWIILKFDSLGRYQYNCKIQAYLSHVCIKGSNIILRIDPSNQLTFCITVRDFDSIDFVDSKGFLYKRIITPNTRDSTLIFTGKLKIDGEFYWINTISRITQVSPVVPTYNDPPNSSNITNRFTKKANALTLTNNDECKVDIDLYELYQPYKDTLLLTYDNGISVPVYVTGQDLRLIFTNAGSLFYNIVPFRLAVNNTADHMEVLSTTGDGINTYNLLRIRLNSKDTLVASSPLALNIGENIVLVKNDNKDSLIWATLIGSADKYILNFNVDYDSTTKEIAFGFYYRTFTFNYSVPAGAYPYGVTHVAKFSTDGNIVWNTIYGSSNDIVEINSLSFNPVNHGLILIGRFDGLSTQLKLENYILLKNSSAQQFFIARFDSLNRCQDAEMIKSTNYLNTYLGSLWNTNPITDQKGRTYITGAFMDSIWLTCNTYIHTRVQSNNGYDGYVLVTDPLPFYVDTSVCKQMLSFSGKYTYDTAGLYHDTLTSVAGCDSLILINLHVLNTKNTIDTAVCNIYISPSGKYQVDSNTTLFDTIPNQRGCDSALTIHVSLLKSQSNIDTFLCAHYISPSNRYTADSSTTIFDTIPNYKGCDSTMIIHVHILQSKAAIDTMVCDSFVSPSSMYTWNNDGVYVDTITNSAGCDSIITIHLTISKSFAIVDTIYCGNLISPSGKYTYTNAGTYLDTIPNANGCDSIITIKFQKSDLKSTAIIHSCSIVTSPSGKYQYNTSGTYIDTIRSVQSCDSIITLEVTIDSLIVKVSKSNDITCDTPFAILNVTKGKFFSWSPQNFLNDAHISNPIATPKQKTLFYVQVQDSFGCAASDSIELDVNKKETITDLPNVFTPNNDGINDCLTFQSITSFKTLSFTIFNRWGNIVFQSTNPNDCWNGKNQNNQEVSEGVYYFIVKGVSICDTEITQNGTIELIR